MNAIWSNTDFPYMCLKDVRRTLAFRQAIREAVSPGDTVLDLGAGTGILSLFALEAGAGCVYAVEIEPLLCRAVQATAGANNVADRLIVLEGDAHTVSVSGPVDVVIAEMMDTGLIEEHQASVLNELRHRGVLGSDTKVVPERYRMYIEFVAADHTYFGFQILAPKHEWPFYSGSDGWHPTGIEAVTARILVAQHDFRTFIDPALVDARFAAVILDTQRHQSCNAVRVSAESVFQDGTILTASNALNGDKIISIPTVESTGALTGSVRYILGGGLSQFEILLDRP